MTHNAADPNKLWSREEFSLDSNRKDVQWYLRHREKQRFVKSNSNEGSLEDVSPTVSVKKPRLAELDLSIP